MGETKKMNDLNTLQLSKRRKILIEELKKEKKKQRALEQRQQQRQQQQQDCCRGEQSIENKKPQQKNSAVKTTTSTTTASTSKKDSKDSMDSKDLKDSKDSKDSVHRLDRMVQREIKNVVRSERKRFAKERKMLVDAVEARIEKVLMDKLTKQNVETKPRATQRRPGFGSSSSQRLGGKNRNNKKNKKKNPKIISKKLKMTKMTTKMTKMTTKTIATQSTPSLNRRRSATTNGVAAGSSISSLNGFGGVTSGGSAIMDQTDDSLFGEDFNHVGGWEELQDLLAFHSPAPSVKKPSVQKNKN